MTEPDAEFLVIFRDEANERLDNIVATLLSVAMMYEWLGEHGGLDALGDAADLLQQAIARVFADRRVLPFEFGGSSGTRDITTAVIAQVQAIATGRRPE